MIKIKVHGFSSTEHPLYQIWKSMRQRCNNANSQNYKEYGGRGIAVCDRWNKSFRDFACDMFPSWEPRLTIDRRNNDGEYSAFNCDWVTRKEQANNRREREVASTSVTGITGVSLLKRTGRYKAQTTINGENKYLGYFTTIEEATQAVENAKANWSNKFPS